VIDGVRGILEGTMGEKVSATLKVLREIRDDVRGVRDEVRATNARLDGQVERLDGRMDSLETQVREGFLRVATEMVAVAQAIGATNDILRSRFDQHDAIRDHEDRLRRLEKRVG